MDSILDLCQKIRDNKNINLTKTQIQSLVKNDLSLDQLDQVGYLEILLQLNLEKNLTLDFLISVLKIMNYKTSKKLCFKLTENQFQILFKFLIKQDLQKINDENMILILQFLIYHFQMLEYEGINSLILELVSSRLLLKVSQNYLRSYLLQYPHLIPLVEKLMKNSKKMINQETIFFNNLFQILIQSKNKNLIEIIIQFYIELLCTINTRKFLKPYLKGNYIIPQLTLKDIDISNLNLLKNLINFNLNDETGEPLQKNHIMLLKTDFYKKLQIFLFKTYEEQFTLKQIEELEFLKYFEDQTQEMRFIFEYMGIPLPENKDISFLVLVFQDFAPKDNTINYDEIPLIPTEQQLFYDTCQPKLRLNLQFLTLQDYLERNFSLLKQEFCYEISKDIQECVDKMTPIYDKNGKFTNFQGWSRMGQSIQSIQIQDITSPSIGQKVPQKVFAEITYSVAGLPNYLRKEWESLQKYDVIFLVSFNESKIQHVRGAEIVSQLDDQRNDISKEQKGNIRTLQIEFDCAQFAIDFEQNIQEIVYNSLKMIVRRKSKENNFKSHLFAIKDQLQNPVQLPEYLNEQLLGYGNYQQQINTKFFQNFDFVDTFIDKKHFQDNFEKNNLLPDDIKSIQKFQQYQSQLKNQIRFNNKQIQAIVQACQPGFQLIKGPPGTGKTDVIVQSISLLYKNFSKQKILVITHSNQALDDIFEKIRQLDNVDQKHIIRLGLGGQKILGKNNFSFGRSGRINYLLQLRVNYLEEAKVLAHSIDYMEDNFTCETAEIFYKFHILPRIQTSKNNFEFSKYQVMKKYDQDQTIDMIEKLFKDIFELRFLELMRNTSERGDNFMCNHARIICMTSTHAALKYQKLKKLQFKYDTLISEEQGQILEISSFIPIALCPPQRIVLIGDEQQLSPIIKNPQSIEHNLDQSLFKRFIRLGFNLINLNEQGRTRDSILNLYKPYYDDLVSLPHIKKDKVFLQYQIFNQPNPGLKDEFQFVETEGQESQPQPFFYQNLEEAEYIVALYMYLRLQGVDNEKITILTAYNGQKFLIRDIIHQKCAWNEYLKRPKKISTIDRYQGLVRTEKLGHLRDPRRLIVALSRARLGLYVFGKLSLFSGYQELKYMQFIYLRVEQFQKKSQKLTLTQNDQKQTNNKRKKSLQEILINNSNELYDIVKNQLTQHLEKL